MSRHLHRRISLLLLCASVIVNVESGPLLGVIDTESTNTNSSADTTTSPSTVAETSPAIKETEQSPESEKDSPNNTASNPSSSTQKPKAKTVESGMVEVGDGKQKIDVHININNNINTGVDTKKEVTPESQTSTAAPATTKLPPALKKKAVDLLKEFCKITYVHVYTMYYKM